MLPRPSPDFDVRSRIIRAVHFILDIVFALIFRTLFVSLVVSSGCEDIFYGISERWWRLLFLIAYYFVFEFEFGFGSPLSHCLTGSKVVTENGESPSRKVLLTRVLLRAIPIDWISFLDNRRGIHDGGSGTYVVSKRVAKEFLEKQEDLKDSEVELA